MPAVSPTETSSFSASNEAEKQDTHPLVARARLDLGRREGDPALPLATAARPWCAAWCSSHLVAIGVLPAIQWGARDLLRLLGRLGYSVPHTGPLAPGDVVAWPRAAGPQAAHVGIVSAVEGGRVLVISGNSAPEGSRRADRVTERWRPAGRVRWAARPLPA